MHMADYNDQLVSNRIWTDSNHIEQRLAELTGHMENVIQVYLRNEFNSIDEYNKFAGDLAEPYRILVVANFPPRSPTRLPPGCRASWPAAPAAACTR